MAAEFSVDAVSQDNFKIAWDTLRQPLLSGMKWDLEQTKGSSISTRTTGRKG